MKTLLLFLSGLLFSTALYAQAPANDSCHHATELSVQDSPTMQTFNTKDASPSEPSWMETNLCNIVSPANPQDVWFKFTSSHIKVAVRFKGLPGSVNYVQLYRGTCGAFTEWECRSTGTGGATDSMVVYTTPGVEYYLRIGRIGNSGTCNFDVCIKTTTATPISKHKLSTATGGLWHVGSTWVGGIAPKDGDSVEIADGARVAIVRSSLPSSTVKLSYLQVGGADSTKHARFEIRGGMAFHLNGDVVLNRHDSLYGAGTSAANAFETKTTGNVYFHGVVNCWVAYEFVGTTPQSVTGRGRLNRDTIYSLSIKNPTEVTYNFPVNLSYELHLISGTLKCPYPLVFRMMPTMSANRRRLITRGAGRLEGKLVVEEDPAYIAMGRLLWTDYSYQTGWGPDTVQHFGQEVDPSKMYHLINVNHVGGGKIYLDTGMRVSDISTQNQKIIMKPGDTLTARDNGAWVVGGTPCVQQYPYFYTTYVSGMSNGDMTGKRRSLNISRISSNAPHFLMNPNHKMCLDYFGQRPQGPVVAPLQLLEGTSYMKINSSGGTIPNGISFRMDVFALDSMKSDPSRWRIAQSVGPNGPWRDAGGGNGTTNTLTSVPIDWSKGSYFALATTARPYDLKLVNVVPPPFYKGACQDGPTQRLGFVFQSLGIMPVTAATVGYTLNGGPVQQAVGTSLPRTLRVLDRDTFWLSGANGPVIDQPQVYDLKAWIHLDQDTSPANDTVRVQLNYAPAPLPYLQTFDTVSGRVFGWAGNFAPNLPYRWHCDSLAKETERILNQNTQINSSWSDPDIWYLNSWNQPATSRYLINNVSSASASQPVLLSEPIGPVQHPTWVRYRYIYGLFETTLRQMGPQDTVYIEYRDTCYTGWRALRKIHRGNWVPSASYRTLTDSLPAPDGSIISLRIRARVPGSSYRMGMDSIQVFRDTTLQVSRLAAQGNVHGYFVYPNPGTAHGFVELGRAHARAEVSIVDAAGRQVYHRRFTHEQTLPFTLAGPPGLYLVRVKDEKERLSVLKYMKE